MAISRKNLGWLLIIPAVYLMLPIGAGVFGVGDKRGPKIYPEGLHKLLFSLPYEIRHGNDPADNVGLDRPWFYTWPSKNKYPTG